MFEISKADFMPFQCLHADLNNEKQLLILEISKILQTVALKYTTSSLE